jgi:hypothetical protein
VEKAKKTYESLDVFAAFRLMGVQIQMVDILTSWKHVQSKAPNAHIISPKKWKNIYILIEKI